MAEHQLLTYKKHSNVNADQLERRDVPYCLWYQEILPRSPKTSVQMGHAVAIRSQRCEGFSWTVKYFLPHRIGYRFLISFGVGSAPDVPPHYLHHHLPKSTKIPHIFSHLSFFLEHMKGISALHRLPLMAVCELRLGKVLVDLRAASEMT